MAARLSEDWRIFQFWSIFLNNFFVINVLKFLICTELPKPINMKKLILIICLLVSYGINAQERYLDPVFPSVTVTSEIVYGLNVTVITGAPALDTLTMDIYEPDRKSTRLNSSHPQQSRMPSSA